MLYMNDYDRDYALRRFAASRSTRRYYLAQVVERLAQWADANSDGWAYWPKPARAAKQAMTHIASTTNAANDAQEREDITEAEVVAALRPIKAFLTRENAPQADRDWILQ